MRQIRPRTSHPTLAPRPSRPPLLVDLRDQPGAVTSEELLRAQLAQAKRAVREVTQQLAVLIDERDVLMARLEQGSPKLPADADDRWIVPWGFCDDEAQ